MRYAWTIGLALGLAAPTAFAGACPTRPKWPTADFGDAKATMDPAKVAELTKYAFTLTGEDAERKGIRTDGVLVVKGGDILYENYGRGWKAEQKHIAWSVTKSVTATLAGAAVQKGLLGVDDSICKHLPEIPQDNCGITVKHLLQMASGLDWKEIYENESNQLSSVLGMLYGQGHTNMPAFVWNHSRRDEPGATWMYSTGESTLLSAVVKAAMKGEGGADWPWKLLFERIGTPNVTYENDASGNPGGGSFYYGTTRDLAKLGFLWLNDGCWNGERILPEGWMADAATPQTPFLTKALEWEDGDVYGRHFWLNKIVPEVGQKELPHKDIPDNVVMALGHWGQSCVIFPTEDLVVVRYANDRVKKPVEGAFDRNEFLKRAMALGSTK